MQRRSLEEAVAQVIGYAGRKVNEKLEVIVFVHDEDASRGEMELKWDIYTSAENNKAVYDLLNSILNCSECTFYVDADTWEDGGSVSATYRWEADPVSIEVFSFEEAMAKEEAFVGKVRSMGVSDVVFNRDLDLSLMQFTTEGSDEYKWGQREVIG